MFSPVKQDGKRNRGENENHQWTSNHSAQTSFTKEIAGKEIERKWKQITASYCK